MISIIKEVSISCESKVDHHCINEVVICLTNRQKISVAIKEFKKDGWDVDKCICPYCLTLDKSKGRYGSQYNKPIEI